MWVVLWQQQRYFEDERGHQFSGWHSSGWEREGGHAYKKQKSELERGVQPGDEVCKLFV
jgi:hypothetical protein